MHIVTPKLVPKTYNNMIQAPVIQTVQTQEPGEIKLLQVGNSSLQSILTILKARDDFCLNLFLKKHDEKIDLLRCKSNPVT